MKRRQKLVSWLAIAAFGLAVAGSIFAQQADTGQDIFLAEPLSGPPPIEYVPNEIIIKFREETATNVEKALSEGKKAKEVKFSDSLDKLNNKHKLKHARPLFRDFKKQRQQLQALHNKNKSLLTKKDKHILRRLKRAPKNARVPDLDRIYELEVDLEDGESLEDVVAAYRSDPDVEYAELNYIVSINLTPNDTLYPLQWPLDNIGQDYPISGGQYTSGKSGAGIDAPEAWDIEIGSSEVIVAVVDTGVDYNHRDLDDNMWTDLSGNYGYDFINGDNNPIDDNGHGTHCAGIIAAEGDNGVDIAGVCWNAKIMPLKFLDSSGRGRISDAVTAFYYAVENGADVISNSWGGGGYMPALQDAIDYAYSQGVVIVVAAGNGNSNDPQYPAYYEHVISVAATDSNDIKASFSNYGDWIDIAAPGVDILSLRASGTDMYLSKPEYIPGDRFFPHGDPDATSYISSGTSMACPHVAGAFALLLSVYHDLQIDEAKQILMESAEPIAPEICISGRLNLNGAMLRIMSPQGRVLLDKEIYSCSDSVIIRLFDLDLRGNEIQQVNVSTDGGDFETVQLAETIFTPGFFTETISVDSADINIEDGVLQVSHDQIITATYYDDNDGTGNPEIVSYTAIMDCQEPLVFNINVHPFSTSVKVEIETDEASTVYVKCGQALGGPYPIVGESLTFAKTHTVYLPNLANEADYCFVIETNDVSGNEGTDDNDGQGYWFTTTVIPEGVNVPGEYATIQAAIDAAVNGDTIIVADGFYTGEGNRDNDFKGKAITLRSENGPEDCIIDCNGTEAEPHSGFYFHNNEDANSVLDGFTIVNGFADRGGGIYIYNSSPTIRNCKISYNNAEYGGGGIYTSNSASLISNCIISFNKNEKSLGGGIVGSSCTIKNCIIENNKSAFAGGIAASSSTCINCTIENNIASVEGGGVSFYIPMANNTIPSIPFSLSRPLPPPRPPLPPQIPAINTSTGSSTFINCTIKNNISFTNGGGVSSWGGNAALINCTIIGNKAIRNGGGIWCDYVSRSIITQCTISNNIAINGGGVFSSASYPRIISSIIYDNQASKGKELFLEDWNGANWPSYCTILYSNIKRGQSDIYGSNSQINWGEGNIEADPCFINPENEDFRLSDSSPCIDAGAPYYYLFGQHFADMDGNCRLAGSSVDIGSYEFGSSQDSDADLLSDADEIVFGSKHDNSDTDNDGLLDGVEVLRETNPTVMDIATEISVPTQYSSIQQGLFLAFPLETVTVSPGTYKETLHFQGKNLILQSTDHLDDEIISTTIINANKLDAAITFSGSENSNCAVRGFTVTNGGFSGINGNGCEAVIEHNIISNNFMPSLSGNTGGGGVTNCDGLIQNNIISHNKAAEAGGGIARSDGEIRRNIISNNFSGYMGGGISRCGGLIAENIIANNDSGRGGGAIFLDSLYSPTITNCLIVGNLVGTQVVGNGGAIYYKSNYGLKVINCTIVENKVLGSSGRGGGIYCSGTLTMINSIVRNNTSVCETQLFISGRNANATVSSCNFDGGTSGVFVEDGTLSWGEGNIDVDPCFVEPGYWEVNYAWVEGDYHLLSDSPCIDAGDPNYEPEPNETDLDGRPRVLFGRVDIGAYEFNNIPIANAGDDQAVYVGSDGIIAVRLDGSGSFDTDDDTLEYFWFIGNERIAIGVDPNVQLSVGEHTIELIVNDGVEDSEPDEVVITIVGPLEVDVHIVPRTINRNNRMKRVMAIISLPNGISKHDMVDEPFVLYAGDSDSDGIEATWQRVIGRGNMTRVFALFDKAELMDVVPNNGSVELTIVGKLESGQYVYGTNTIRVIKPRRRRWWRRRWN